MAGYNLDFYAESRQHAIAYLTGQGMAPEVETMLGAAIANMSHDGPLHVKASGALADTPDAADVSMGSYEVAPVNFVDVVPASLPNEAPAVSWKAWLEGKRHPEKAAEEKARAAEAAHADHMKTPGEYAAMERGQGQNQTLAEHDAAMERVRAANQPAVEA